MAARSAIVTGGGTGIGAAIARRLSADGYAVAVMGRRAEVLDEVVGELSEGIAVTGDVGRPEDCERAVAATVEAFGGVDALVNNAGIGNVATGLEETPEQWDHVLRINLSGAFYMARAALPHLIERRGAIVNISSTSGYVAGPGWTSYCTSKAGLIMLGRCLANDYGPAGVRANTVCPGWVRTPMGDEDMDVVAELGESTARRHTASCTRTPRSAGRPRLTRSLRLSPSSSVRTRATSTVSHYRWTGAP